MANPEHVKIVRQGADAIAAWRKKHPKEPLDLSGADLCEANLCEANLSGANLGRTDLIGARLIGATLDGAHLSSAVLVHADLSDAHLRLADLLNADLTNANLTGADLTAANLSCSILRIADLRDADLTYAFVAEAVFADLDLGTVRGLESLKHAGPSTIGVDTLFRSKGKIPEVFLRGCGLQPWEILQARMYDPSLSALQVAELQNEIFTARTKGPIYIGGVFISYAREDSAFVDKLYERLGKVDVSVWLDRHDLDAGPVERQVVDAIRLNDVVLLVLSTSSVNSDWVDYEVKKALEKEKAEKRDVLCPVALDEAWKAKTEHVPWHKVKEKNILDFSKWETEAFEGEFEKLLRGLKKYYPPAEQEGSPVIVM